MALNIPDQHMQTAIQFSLAGDLEPMYTTLAVRNDGVAWADGGDADALANGVLGAFNTNVGTPKLGNIYSTVGVHWRAKIGLVEYSGFHAIAADAGGQAGPWPPQNTCALIKKSTAGLVGFRSGRMYCPGVIRESDVDDVGTIASASLTALQTAFTNYYAALLSIDLQPMVLASFSSSNPLGAPSEVSSFTVDGRVATQRRRLRR